MTTHRVVYAPGFSSTHGETTTSKLSAENADISGELSAENVSVRGTLSSRNFNVTDTLNVNNFVVGDLTINRTHVTAETATLTGQLQCGTAVVNGGVQAETLSTVAGIAVGGTMSAASLLVDGGTGPISAGNIEAGTLSVTGGSTMDSASITNDAVVGGYLAVAGDAMIGGTLTGTLTGTATNVTTTINSTITTLSALTLPASQLSGTVAIATGGTGSTTASEAITALTGTQTSGTYLRSNGTVASLSAIQAADVPTLNQNTTGTASNVTATTNATLTTLPALSLPGSQVSGNIGGNASNVTATTNATLTTLPSLSLPGSQVSGNIGGNASNVTGTVAIATGGTGSTTASAAITALTGTQTSGTYLRSNGTAASLSAIQAADVPTLNQNTTGTASNVTATTNATLTSLPALSLPIGQVSGLSSANLVVSSINTSGNSTVGGSLQNSTTNTLDSTGVGFAGTRSVNWAAVDPGYAACVCNSDGTAQSGALLLKTLAAGTNPVLSVDSGAAQGAVGTARFRVLGNGNVGIGTATPSAQLEIFQAAADAASNIRLSGAGGGGATANILFAPFNARSGGPAAILRAQDNFFSCDLVFLVAASGAPENVATERMRVTTAGNFGIGTPNPGQPLDVNGASRSVQFLGGGTVPTITRLGGAGTTATVTMGAGSTGTAGSISILAGGTITNAAGTNICRVNFPVAYAAAPFISLTPSNTGAGNLTRPPHVASTTTGFTLNQSGTAAMASGTTYSFHYHVIG